jgi:hypothetical protein
MKLPNFLIHTFAAVGVISLIFWSCAAADSDSIDNPPQLTGGTYQVETLNAGANRIVVLNTETGVMKTYFQNNGVWSEYDGDYAEVIFTH